MSCILKQGTAINYVDDSEAKNEVRAFQMNHGASHRKEDKLLVKGLTHSGSGVLLVFLPQ